MRISLDNLRPGMVLATDILDPNGRLLLPNGTALTEKHIRYCQMWGIPDAEIAGGDDGHEEPNPVIDSAMVAEVERVVGTRFAHVDREHPAMAALFRHCVTSEIRKRS